MSSLRSRGFPALVAGQAGSVFNDNAYRYLAIFILFHHPRRNLFIALTGILLIVPFVLFSGLAGWLSDRLSKRTVMLWAKVGEVVAMCLGLVALLNYMHSPDTAFSIGLLLSVVFLMGLQSAIFSPAKYGSVPELVAPVDVARANGLLEMTVFAGIILGCGAAPLLYKWAGPQLWKAAVPLIGVALLGAAAVKRVHPTAVAEGEAPRLQLGQLARNLALLHKHRGLFMAALAYAYFMLIGAMFNLNIVVYGKGLMGLSESRVALLLAVTGVSLAVGAGLSGHLSRRRVELGVLPLGAFGLALFPILLHYAPTSYAAVIALVAGAGLSGGLFVVPLATYIQLNCRPRERGRVMATWNFMNYVGVILGSGAFYFCTEPLGLNPAEVFLAMGAATVPIVIYIMAALPMFAVRFVVKTLLGVFYRITSVGLEHIPESDGALLVSNHVSFIDALLIGSTLDRDVRFIMSEEYARKPLIGRFANLFDTIIINTQGSPREIMRSIRQARQALENGDLVCIFAEGVLTRTGNINPFKRGLEAITRRLEVPVIPVHLDRVWGSIFSYERGKFFFKMPHRIPYAITVSVGAPLGSNVTAFAVRQAIQELSADAFHYRRCSQRPLHWGFVRSARRRLRADCMADTTGVSLSWGRALTAVLILARHLRRHCRGQRAIGIMLPASAGAALTNVAALMAGKVPVNLNFTTSQEALDSAVRQADIQTVISSRKFLRRIELRPARRMLMLEDLRQETTWGQQLFFAAAAFLLPAFALERLLCAPADMDDMATIVFTSGSTGIPKGAVLSHHNIVSNGESASQVIQFERDDVMMGVLPFFHAFGLTATLWLPLLTGLKAVYHPNPLEPRIVGKTMAQFRATILLATPSFYLTYVRRCEPAEFASLRLPVVGGEKLHASIASEFEQHFGKPLYEGYGCTETGPVVSVNIPDVETKGMRQVGRKPGSVGMPLPGVAVRIVDNESGTALGADQEGLILVKGPNVMQRYLEMPEKTWDVFRGEWYVTGDIGKVDTEGFLWITDRLARFSKIGGEMVPHLRIEDAIAQALGRNDRPCLVVSLPDERKGERLVVLHTVAGLDPRQVVESLADQGLPRFWIPSQGAFHYVEEIPLLGSGKLDMRRSMSLADKMGRAKTETQQ